MPFSIQTSGPDAVCICGSEPDDSNHVVFRCLIEKLVRGRDLLRIFLIRKEKKLPWPPTISKGTDEDVVQEWERFARKVVFQYEAVEQEQEEKCLVSDWEGACTPANF